MLNEPDIDESDPVFDAFQKIQKIGEQAALLLKTKFTAAPTQLEYRAIEEIAFLVWGISPNEITIDIVEEVIHRLARKVEGGVELDSTSFQTAGIDPLHFAQALRTSIHKRGMIQSAASSGSSHLKRLGIPDSLTQIDRLQVEIREELQTIASQHLSKMARSGNRREQICDMTGALYDAFAARRFALVKSEIDVSRFVGELGTYLSCVVVAWFQGVPLDDSEREAMQIEAANRRNYWITEAHRPSDDRNTAPSSALAAQLPVAAETRKPQRGPRRDIERAQMIQEVVRSIATTGRWQDHLDEICEELDEQRVPFPKRWKENDHRSWSDAVLFTRQLVIKTLGYWLKTAHPIAA